MDYGVGGVRGVDGSVLVSNEGRFSLLLIPSMLIMFGLSLMSVLFVVLIFTCGCVPVVSVCVCCLW